MVGRHVGWALLPVQATPCTPTRHVAWALLPENTLTDDITPTDGQECPSYFMLRGIPIGAIPILDRPNETIAIQAIRHSTGCCRCTGSRCRDALHLE